jgi:hypothetical protein
VKNIHHLTKEVCLKHLKNYRQSAYLDLPDGTVIITGTIDSHYRKLLEQESGTTAIPFVGSGDLVPSHVVNSLQHLGVTETDDTMKAVLKICKVHPSFHPSEL